MCPLLAGKIKDSLRRPVVQQRGGRVAIVGGDKADTRSIKEGLADGGWICATGVMRSGNRLPQALSGRNGDVTDENTVRSAVVFT